MFSSNQILEVSGNLSHSHELESALEFALKYSEHDKDLSQEEFDRGCKLVYQITEDGKYCIGWGFETVPNGWFEYPFKFDIASVSTIIRLHLETCIVKIDIWPGTYNKGFIMKSPGTCMALEKDGIIEPFYCIVYFEPFTCFYAK